MLSCRGQAERDLRREQGLPEEEDARGAANPGDAATTNLFVGNLAPDVDESMLMREFGRFGPIGSVKIMWPRDEDQRRRGRNTGFVAFMRRADADQAKNALDGVSLHDLQLTIGWGKAVPLPAVPAWPPPGGLAGGAAAAAAPLAPESTRQRMHDGPPPKAAVVGLGDDIEVRVPEDARQRFVVDATAFYVLRDGCEFEQALMERERGNPEFAFLFDVRRPEHAYYRWRLFSLASGDSLRAWRVDPFLMVGRSGRWVPPPMTAVALAARGAAGRGERRDEGSSLSELQRGRLEGMLRALTADRASIREAMVFALDNADAAADVAELLADSLTLSETPVALRVARLFLVSDILHNTAAAARNASRYRARLQDALPDVFESLQEAYRGGGSRMGQELLRKHVLKVLRVWRGWYIFSDDFLNGLQATFLRGGTGPAGTRAAASEPGAGANNPALAEALAAAGDDEVELKCKHSGLSRRGGREAQVARLLALDSYLNCGAQQAQQQRAAPAADPAPAPAPRSGGGWELVAGAQPSGGAEPSNAADEERRGRLRAAELAALQFREQLEEQGVAAAEVERQAGEHRAKLLAAVDAGGAEAEANSPRRKRDRSREGARAAEDDKHQRR